MTVLSGLVGLAVLIGDVWAIVNILGSRAASAHKLVWVLVILLLPVLGLLIWWFAGPRSSRV